MTDITPTRRELAAIVHNRIKAERRKAAKAARPVSPKKDRGRVRDNAYLAFLRRQPCCVRHLGFCGGPVEAAHIRTPDPKRGKPLTGMQVKPDDKWATPLCRIHHAAQHSMNELAWWNLTGLNPFETAERLFAEFSNQRKDQP